MKNEKEKAPDNIPWLGQLKKLVADKDQRAATLKKELIEKFYSWDGVIPKFKTPFNTKAFPKRHERNIMPSLAVPDQSLSIEEIIKRHTRGIPIFSSEMDYDNNMDPLGGRPLESLDIEEVWQIANTSRQKYQQAQEKFIAEQELKRKDQYAQAKIDEYKKLQERANPPKQEEPPKA